MREDRQARRELDEANGWLHGVSGTARMCRLWNVPGASATDARRCGLSRSVEVRGGSNACHVAIRGGQTTRDRRTRLVKQVWMSRRQATRSCEAGMDPGATLTRTMASARLVRQEADEISPLRARACEDRTFRVGRWAIPHRAASVRPAYGSWCDADLLVHPSQRAYSSGAARVAPLATAHAKQRACQFRLR